MSDDGFGEVAKCAEWAVSWQYDPSLADVEDGVAKLRAAGCPGEAFITLSGRTLTARYYYGQDGDEAADPVPTEPAEARR